MRQYFVGIDVSKGRHTAAVVDEQAQVRIRDFEFADDAPGYQSLLRALTRLPQACQFRVCLEGTGNYGHRLAAFLAEQPGFTVSMVNARCSHHFAKVMMARTKTDRVDAVLLALYARALQPRAMQPAGDEGLARLTRSRQTMRQSLVAQVSMLRSLLERVNPAVEREFRALGCNSALGVLRRYPTGAMLMRARIETVAQIKASSRRLGKVRAGRLVQAARSIPGQQGSESDAVLVRQIVQVIQQVQQSLATLETAIAQQVQGHVLFSIPDVGAQTVPVMLAELPVEQLEGDAQVMAFAGMNPRLRQSGRFAGKVKLSKCGPPQLRRALYMAVLAMVGRGGDSVLHRYYRKKLAEGKKPKAAIIACMSKLLRIIFAILKTGRPFDPEYESRRLAGGNMTLAPA